MDFPRACLMSSAALSLLAVVLVPAARAQGADLEQLLNQSTEYRNLGPFRVGSWISDIAVPDAPAGEHANTIYASARHGGVWKSTNWGATWTPIFDDTGVFAVGCIEVAPSDPDILWVGTGDNSCARSANPGNGVYKSTDAGESFQYMGLPESHHVVRILIHPTDPDIVYIASMGHLFTPNEERGVFKTNDGGETWERMLYVDDTTGVIEMVMDRSNPDTVYAATYQMHRHPWVIHDGGPNSGIHKTTDGGRTWRKLGGGLPAGQIGRIGLDVYQEDPRILYAVVDNRNPDPSGEDMIQGEVYKSEDGGETWRMTIADGHDPSGKAAYSFNQLWINPGNPDQVIVIGASFHMSLDGGRTWGTGGRRGGGSSGSFRPFGRAFGDFRTLWFDPQNPDRMIAGSDGGVYLSFDGGRTCIHLDNLPLGEAYAIGIDMDNPYHIYAGFQDHESWKAPSNGWAGWIGVEEWATVGTSDGMYNQVDPTDSRWLYNNEQFGGLSRVDQVLRTRTRISPQRLSSGERVRYNWTPPIEISPHDPRTIYTGAQIVFRSRDRGDTWEEASPDLTSNDPDKINLPAIQHCTVLTISESPVTAGIIWAGTDDGFVHVTRDDGGNWTDVSQNLYAAGAPDESWVSRVFASHFEAGTAYVTISRLRQDDFRPFVFKTTDYGATWASITSDLPSGSVNVVHEDNVNPDLLFVGSDSGVYVTVDGGRQWSSLRGNMPPAPVHDLVVHPREGDLVVGTYARSLFVTNIVPLRELNAEVLTRDAFLFTPPARGRRMEGRWGNYRLYGDKVLTTPNEPNGIVMTYYLRQARADGVTIEVTDSDGNGVATLRGPGNAGLNQTLWSLTGGGGRGLGARGFGRRGRGARGAGGPSSPPEPGDYTATLRIGDQALERPVRVLETVVLRPGG